jgi:predicted ATPase
MYKYLWTLKNRHIKGRHSSNIVTWNKKIVDWDTESKEFKKLNDLIIAHNLPGFLLKIDKKIKTYLEDTQYIAPVRAKALRYYRYQDLSVSEIDAYGDNMHMFLDNLSVSQKSKYQIFIKNIFGFTVYTESRGGHLTINIQDEKGESYNLADLGFGYSQVLPIITKLWYVSSERYSKWGKTGNNITVLIEQPELHLHPAMQAQLADAFVLAINLSKENGIKLNLIIETHSSTIINRLGRKIIDKKIEKENINVILFNPDENLENSVVTKTSFNDKGILLNWPLGFFEPKN